MSLSSPSTFSRVSSMSPKGSTYTLLSGGGGGGSQQNIIRPTPTPTVAGRHQEQPNPHRDDFIGTSVVAASPPAAFAFANRERGGRSSSPRPSHHDPLAPRYGSSKSLERRRSPPLSASDHLREGSGDSGRWEGSPSSPPAALRYLDAGGGGTSSPRTATDSSRKRTPQRTGIHNSLLSGGASSHLSSLSFSPLPSSPIQSPAYRCNALVREARAAGRAIAESECDVFDRIEAMFIHSMLLSHGVERPRRPQNSGNGHRHHSHGDGLWERFEAFTRRTIVDEEQSALAAILALPNTPQEVIEGTVAYEEREHRAHLRELWHATLIGGIVRPLFNERVAMLLIDEARQRKALLSDEAWHRGSRGGGSYSGGGGGWDVNTFSSPPASPLALLERSDGGGGSGGGLLSQRRSAGYSVKLQELAHVEAEVRDCLWQQRCLYIRQAWFEWCFAALVRLSLHPISINHSYSSSSGGGGELQLEDYCRCCRVRWPVAALTPTGLLPLFQNLLCSTSGGPSSHKGDSSDSLHLRNMSLHVLQHAAQLAPRLLANPLSTPTTAATISSSSSTTRMIKNKTNPSSFPGSYFLYTAPNYEAVYHLVINDDLLCDYYHSPLSMDDPNDDDTGSTGSRSPPAALFPPCSEYEHRRLLESLEAAMRYVVLIPLVFLRIAHNIRTRALLQQEVDRRRLSIEATERTLWQVLRRVAATDALFALQGIADRDVRTFTAAKALMAAENDDALFSHTSGALTASSPSSYVSSPLSASSPIGQRGGGVNRNQPQSLALSLSSLLPSSPVDVHAARRTVLYDGQLATLYAAATGGVSEQEETAAADHEAPPLWVVAASPSSPFASSPLHRKKRYFPASPLSFNESDSSSQSTIMLAPAAPNRMSEFGARRLIEHAERALRARLWCACHLEYYHQRLPQWETEAREQIEAEARAERLSGLMRGVEGMTLLLFLLQQHVEPDARRQIQWHEAPAQRMLTIEHPFQRGLLEIHEARARTTTTTTIRGRTGEVEKGRGNGGGVCSGGAGIIEQEQCEWRWLLSREYIAFAQVEEMERIQRLKALVGSNW